MVAIVGEQNSRLTEVSKHHDMVMSNMSNELCELRRIVKELQEGSTSRSGEGGARAQKPMKFHLAQFSGEDPQGWIYQAEAYFQYHGIADDTRLQIANFHMSKEALSWIRGLQRNNLLTTWEKFTTDLKERFDVSDYEDKLEELAIVIAVDFDSVGVHGHI